MAKCSIVLAVGGAEDGPAWGCPTGRNSCPTQHAQQGYYGLDPISNYMVRADVRGCYTVLFSDVHQLPSVSKPNLLNNGASIDSPLANQLGCFLQDYSVDPCMTQFTAKQASRAIAIWQQYRAVSGNPFAG